MAKNIIIFRESTDDISNTPFGFKIVDSKLSEKYFSLINKLANRNIEFDFGYGTLSYDIDKFEILKISNSDIKILEKIFDIEIGDHSSEPVGIFPDVMNDAYEVGLISDIDEGEDEEDIEDDEY